VEGDHRVLGVDRGQKLGNSRRIRRVPREAQDQRATIRRAARRNEYPFQTDTVRRGELDPLGARRERACRWHDPGREEDGGLAEIERRCDRQITERTEQQD
jgi:hypothetical protein